MRLLAELLMLPLTGPIRALRFIAEQVQAEMDAAVMDEGRLEAELINLSLRHDLGQISGEEYEAEEAYLLEQLDAIRAYEEALLEDYQAALDADYAYVDEEPEDDADDGMLVESEGAAENEGDR